MYLCFCTTVMGFGPFTNLKVNLCVFQSDLIDLLNIINKCDKQLLCDVMKHTGLIKYIIYQFLHIRLM